MDRIDTGLDNKQIMLNMIFSIISFILNMLINFFVTPYITSQLGSEAYGFIKLANDFANYAALITLALNSMAGRFIMINRTVGKTDEAKKYFSSVAIANIILSAALVIPSVICVGFLQNLISIPQALVLEVKITFGLTFFNLVLNLLFTVYGSCFYLVNRLELQALRSAQSNIIKALITVVLLVLLTPRISYIAIATIGASVFVITTNIYYTKKLTPDMKVRVQYFEFKKVKEMLSSGIWNSITKLSQILKSGLDLLITNVFIDSVSMGYLSLAKTIPNIITGFNATIANAFSANLLELYAKDDIKALRKAVKTSMRVMCIFVAIPNAILISMGKEFFQLWVPEQPATMINILSILTVVNSCVTGPMQPLYQIFTITNKIKNSSIVMITYGIINTIIVYICLQTTSLGVYAVAGVSLFGSIIVALAYHLPYSAIYIGLPWYTFFPEIGKSIISFVVACLVGGVVNYVLPLQENWLYWFIGAGITGFIALLINMFIILHKSERTVLINSLRGKFTNKIKRGKK